MREFSEKYAPLQAKTKQERRARLKESVDPTILDELTEPETKELDARLRRLRYMQAQESSVYDLPPGRTKDNTVASFESANRTNRARIEELLTGYPQTGSFASVIAKESLYRGDRKVSRNYRLVQQSSFFWKNIEKLARAEQETFGTSAFAESQLGIYTPAYTGNKKITDTDSFVLGYVWREIIPKIKNANIDEDQDELAAYLLALCASDPNDPSPLGRDLPRDAILLNALGTNEKHQGNGLGLDLGNTLLAFAGNRTVYETVKPDNFAMMSLLAQLGEVRRDPNYIEGPYAGRSRSIELLYWRNHYGNSPDDDRIICGLDPGLFISDKDATLRSDDPIVDPITEDIKAYINREVEGHPNSDRIVLRNKPESNSANNLRPTNRFKSAVRALLENGQYVGVPLGRHHRLYIRVDSLEPRTARIIHEHYRIINERREQDYLRRFGRRVLTNT